MLCDLSGDEHLGQVEGDAYQQQAEDGPCRVAAPWRSRPVDPSLS